MTGAAPMDRPPAALVAQGGMIALRVDVMEIEPGKPTKVAVLQAQHGGLIRVDCPMVAENVDALIDALRQVRAQLGPALEVAGADVLGKLGRANGRG